MTRTLALLATALAALGHQAGALRSLPTRAHLARPSALRALRPAALPSQSLARSALMSTAASGATPEGEDKPESKLSEEEQKAMELCDSEDIEESCTLPMGVTVPMSLVNKAKLGLCFGVWFFLNIMYNLTNKVCQNAFPMPWTMAAVSLFVGIPYVLFLWATGIRKAPKINPGGWSKLIPIGLFHAAGHASAIIALGAGAVSFAQIVKAGEPVFTCLLSYFVLGQTFTLPVYLSLLPIIGGVALASLKELSFTWRALIGAMMSNLAFACRAVYSKAQMQKPVGENLNAANLYGILTIIAFIATVPFFCLYELPIFAEEWAKVCANQGAPWILKQMFLDGVYFYAYNEVAFYTLSQVAPITHAIGNTLKRVAIIATTIVVFKNPVSNLSIIGSVIAIAGAMLYSIVKARESEKMAAKAA